RHLQRAPRERIVVAIETAGLLDILAHPNPTKYPRQRVLVVACDSYVYLVPFVEEEATSIHQINLITKSIYLNFHDE
ncbi:MAG: hypothetical protein PHH58_17515, partial [Rhodoferax sp.]|nr:hypothetical protein [Rhodoferax sp.]